MPVRHTRIYRRIAFLLALLFPTVCAKVAPSLSPGSVHDYKGALIITALILIIFVMVEVWDSHTTDPGAGQ